MQIFKIAVAAAALALGAGVMAQAYPNKPIRIVTSQPGGSSDFNARLIAQGISGPLGQPVIAENRGGPIISAQNVANATPDGYTLMANGGSFWVGIVPGGIWVLHATNLQGVITCQAFPGTSGMRD